MKQFNFKSDVHPLLRGDKSACGTVHRLKSLALVVGMLLFVGNVWGATDYSTLHTSNVTFTKVTNASNCKVKISSVDYDALKLGGSKATGTMSFKIPAGTTKFYIHTAGWKGDGTHTLNLSASIGTLTITSISLTNDDNITGTATTFTLDATTASTTYYREVSISNVTAESTITCTTSAKRAVVWGINTVSVIDTRTAVNMTGFTTDGDATSIVKGNTLGTSVTNDQSGWSASYTYESDDEDVATVNANGVITGVAKGTAKITASLNVAQDDKDYKAGATTSKSVDITVTNPVYTITWKANGQTYTTTSAEEGPNLVLPADPSPATYCDGKVFTGWTATQDYENPTKAPAYVKNGDDVSGAATYYAVFADEEGGDVTKSFGWETASDADWTVSNSISRTEGTTNNPANSGSYYGSFNSNVQVQFKNKVNVKAFSYYCVRKTTNTNTSITIQTSTNGTSWTDALSTAWKDFKSDGKTYTKIEKTWDGTTQYYVRLNIVTGANRMLDDVSITYNGTTYSNYTTSCSSAPSPKVTMTGTLSAFTYPATLGPSAAQSVTVSGTNLTADITVSASTNYEVCLTENGTYTSSVTLTQSSGSVAETTVFVRLAAGLSQADSYAGTLTAASTDATSKVINLSGSVTVAPLTTIQQVIEATTSTETARLVKMTDWIISGKSSDNTAFITTNGSTIGMKLYAYSHGFNAGDKLNGLATLKTKTYDGYAEFTDLKSSTSGLTITSGASLDPVQVSDLSTVRALANQGALIKFTAATYNKNGYFEYDDDNWINFDDYFDTDVTLTAGKKYNVTGIIVVTKQSSTTYVCVAPRTASDIVELNCEVNPTITAATADNIGEDAATLHCASGITAIGEYCEIESYGFEYGTASDLEGATKVEVGTTYAAVSTAFETTLSSLTPNTKYYYRAYATNGKGTAYSDIANFTTEQSTTPIIGLNKTSIDFGTKLSGQSYQETFVITGSTLTENVTITGAEAPITLSKSSFTAAEVMAEGGVTVTVTLTPTAKESVEQTLTISSGSASPQELTITAETQVPYVVTFHVPSGVTAPAVQNITPGETANLTVEPTGSITGATFLGWVATAQAEETTTKIDPLTSFTPEADANLYALYKRVDAVDMNGYALSVTYNNNTKYAGAFGSSLFTVKESFADAEVFFFDEDGHIYIYDGNTKKYVYNSGDNTKVYIGDKQSSESWTISDSETAGLIRIASTALGSRLFSYNNNNGNPRFAAYKSSTDASYVFDLLRTAKSKEVGTTYYSTNPTVVEISGITVTTEPTKKDYFEGDNFDATGMVVKAQYTGGKADKIISDYTVNPSTNLVAGTTSVTISYGGKSTTQAITVTAIEATKIVLDPEPTQKVFLQGGTFNTDGMVVKAEFNDATKNRTLESSEYTVSTPDMSLIGKQTITVSYTYKVGNTKEATYEIQINSALNGISLNTDNVKKTYIETETFNPANLEVTASYGTGDPKVVTENITYFIGEQEITSSTVLAGLNTLDAATNKTITVKYTEFGSTVSSTYDVTVNPYPRYSVTFMEKGAQKGDVLTESQGQGGVTAPTATDKIGEYTFVGWSATNPETETTVKPELVTLTSGVYYPTENITLYAIYSTVKATEVQGKKYQLVVGSNTYYISSYSSNSLYLTTTEADAMTLWYNDGFIRYYNSTYTRYDFIYYSGSNLLTTNAKNTAASYLWTKNVSGDKVYFVENGSSKVLSKNESSSPQNYMRCYVSSNNYPYLMTEIDGDKATFDVSNYTSMPDSRSIPKIKFTTATVNTPVLTDATDHTSLATYTNNTLSTDNTEGAKTFSLADGDDAVASINSSTGEVTAKKAGAVTVTVTIEGTAEWFEGSASYSLTFDKMTPTIQFVDVTDNKATIYTGAANKVTFTATTTSDATIEYSSSNENYATIASTGETEGKAVGYCTLYAGLAATDLFKAVTGNSRAKVSLTVKSNAKTQTLSFATPSYEFANGSSPEDFTNELTGAKTTVHYESNNTALATVNETSGLVHIVSTATPGTATITANAPAGDVVEEGVTYAYAAASTTFTINVNYPKPVIKIDNEGAIVSGKMRGSQNVTLTAPDATYIIYTTDGTEPTWDPLNGIEYENPFLVETSCTVKAIAVGSNNEVSPVAEMSFTKADNPVVLLKVNDVAKDPDYSYDVKMSDEVVLNATGCKINYQVENSNEVVVAEGTNCSATTPLSFTKGGTYTVTASAKYDKTRGFEGEESTWTIVVSGPAHLPIHMTENGNNMPSYMTKSGSVGKYDNTTANVKIEAQGSYIMASFLDKPEAMSFDFKFNGDTWTDLNNVFTVKQSANGSTWSTLFTIDKNTQAAGASLISGTLYTFSFTTADGLNEATRYIKWEYTTKESGNIGVGNIQIAGASIVIDGVDVVDIPDDYTGNVIVAAGGTATIDGEKTLGDMTVQDGGTLTISTSGDAVVLNNLTIETGGKMESYTSNLTVDNFCIKSSIGDNNHNAKSGSLEAAALTVNGAAYIDITLDQELGYTEAGWYAFAVPFAVDALTGVQASLDGETFKTDMKNEVNYAIMDYHTDIRANGQYGWKKYRGTLQPGTMYAITTDDDYKVVRFVKAAGAAISLSSETQITTTLAGDDATNKNWNGIANPNLCISDFVDNSGANYLYFYNHDGNNFVNYQKGTISTVVGSPFMIQAVDNSITMKASTTVRPYHAPAREVENETQPICLQISQNGAHFTDQLYLAANDEATNSYELGHDLSKAFMSGAVKVAQLWCNAYNMKLAAAELPWNGEQADFSITLTAPTAGTYTLTQAAETDKSVYLVKNNAIVWNLSLGAYDIDLNKGENTGYSVRIVERKTPTDVKEVYSTEDGTQKFIYRDKLIIIRDGKVYDGTGALVK